MENDNKFKPHLCQVSNNMKTNLLAQRHKHLGGEDREVMPPLQFLNQTRCNSSSFKYKKYCFL